jgi:glycosyltransferase involved in cell wall biosynthesis
MSHPSAASARSPESDAATLFDVGAPPVDSPSPAVSDAPQQPTASETVPVLHVVNGEHYAGAERVQDLLALRLPELGFAPSFACVKPDRFPQIRRAKDAPLHEVPMRGRWDAFAAGRLAKLVEQYDYRILHAHTPRTLMVARLAAAKTGVPLVYHLHSPTWRDTTRRFANWINAAVERACLARADRVITVSESLKQQMEDRGFDAERLTAVPNGVARLDELPPRDPPSGTWRLGTVALLRPRKGIEVLLDAVALLRAQGHDVRLRAVGPFETPEYEAEIRGRIERLKLNDVVELSGFAADVNAELAQMDLFVLPSLFGEGMPMVVLEAMAAGVPVVASEVEGVPEVILDEWNGVVVRPGNPKRLAEGIERVIGGNLDWSKLRENALVRHRQRFSDESMAEGVASVYRGVLDKRTPASRQES